MLTKLFSKIAIVLLLTGFTQAFACPDLSGVYECKAGSRVTVREFTPTAEGFMINADGIEMNYINDGVERGIDETDSYKEAYFKSNCTNDSFVVDFRATIMYEGAVVGKQVSQTTYNLKQGNLSIVQKTKMKGMPLPVLKYSCRSLN